MKFDHKYIEENEILSKYLLHQLNKEETDKFEEHLLFCSKCREQAKDMGNVFDNLYSELADFDVDRGSEYFDNSGKKNYLNIKFLHRIAASVIIIISIGVFLYLLNNKLEINNQESEAIINDTLIINKKDSIESNFSEPVANVITSLEYDSTLFTELLFFEKIIKDTERSEAIQVKLPKTGYIFSPDSEIVFEWEGATTAIFIAIFDNKGQLLFELNAKNPYVFTKKLKPGLYYWQLENEESSIYTGKFLVK